MLGILTIQLKICGNHEGMYCTLFNIFIYRSSNDLLKILVICNDEFSMLAVQLLIHLIQIDNDNEPPKILFALAALKDDGLIWYKKNMPQ